MTKFTLFVAYVLFWMSSNEAVACSCPIKSFEEFVSDADAVYFATLEEAKVIRNAPNRKWPFIEGRFAIRRTFKGSVPSKEVTLQTGLGGGDCGVPMAVSQTYVIFKKADIDGIHDCDGSHGIYGFQEDEIAEKIRAAMRKKSHALKLK